MKSNEIDKKKVKIVTLDIETSPLEAYTWGLWDVTVGLEQIKTEWSILSFAAKWFGDSKIIYQDASGRGVKKVRDDKHLLQSIWKILDEADLVIAQNGKRFDMRKINARLILSGFPPYSPVRVIDTYEAAKKHFEFTSNKLAWTSKYLTNVEKDKHKEFPGFELWAECLKDNPKAWAEMKKYNIRDITATEQYYLKLRPWIKNHPNMGIYADGDVPTCPKCASEKLQRRGTAVTQTTRYTRYQCTNCGGWSRAKIMLNTLKQRRATLTNISEA
jgi:uncharacterized protein YprB with RNaseH-like and TPR domain/predicted RNA-binding Zn-ribbon protein involved in translation (DUF1610 family)